MVLHLLGKKSWNVYNSENVERVRKDEAEAQARAEAQEQRMQEADHTRRLALLRGEGAPEVPDSAVDEVNEVRECKPRPDDGLPRKRRKLRGEDDTDRDIRYAREDVEAGDKAKQTLLKPDKDEDAPLIDHAGHVQLIPTPDEKSIRKAEKNAEAEAEKVKKRKREEDKYTMRFSNAAGYNNGMEKPWYAAKAQVENNSEAIVLADVQDKDVWGNEDPLRKERARGRISSNDPFAAMQQAQRQLKQSERDKENWQKERREEMEELKREDERRLRRKRKHSPRDEDGDGLEGFSLDAPASKKRERTDHGRHRGRHRHRQSRSRSRSPDRHRRSVHYSGRRS